MSFCICSSCNKRGDIDVNIDVDTTGDSTLLWESFLANGIYQDPIEYHDRIIWGVSQFGMNQSSEKYYAVDKNTGNILWKSEPLSSVSASTYGALACEGYILVNHETDLYAIDAINGLVVWHYKPPNTSFFEPRMAVIGHYVYLTVVDAESPTRTEYIVRTNPSVPKWDTVFSYIGRDGFKPRMEVPALWINENGDSLLILQDRTSRQSPTKESRVDILAIGLESGNIVWRIEDVSPTGNSAIFSPKVFGDNMILALDWWILSVDLHNGKMNWLKEIGNARNHLFTTELEINRERIYFNLEGDDSLICLDLTTGEVIWEKAGRFEVGYAAKGLQYHKGRIFKSAWRHFNQICAVSPGSGELNWLYECDTPDALTSDKSFIIEEQTNRMFISTGKSVIAINLPK